MIEKRIGNLKIQQTQDQRVSLVRYFSDDPDSTCYVLAWWVKGKEGYTLEFIGDRPFHTEVDKDLFWEMVKFGQSYLDAEFELEDWLEDSDYEL